MGSIIGNNVFRADDAPLYKRGYSVLLGLNLLGIVLFVGTKVYYVKKNHERDRVWSAMNDEVCFIPLLLGCHFNVCSNERIISRTALIQGARDWISGLRIDTIITKRDFYYTIRVNECYSPKG